MAHRMEDASSVRYLDHGLEKYASLDRQVGVRGSGASAGFSSGSSAAVREYEDKLKAIDLCRRGLEKAAVAEKLGRSERWVQKWWRQEPQLIVRPHGAQDRVFQRTPLQGFRDVEVTRSFTEDTSLYDTLANTIPWRRGKVMTRDEETGELVLRFDRQGNTIPAARKVADCPRGVGQLDRLLQRTFAKVGIRDPQARVVLNMYEDGSNTLNSHRHDFWTCLISLGAPRVLLVDNRPHILEDGDMITFGTQMHGVPAMPDVRGGRISLVIFFYPDRDNLERRWLTVQYPQDKKEDADNEDEAVYTECAGDAYHNDCRTGSASSATVPAEAELGALTNALGGEALRDRPYWRKSNAELQFMEYPELPEATVLTAGCGHLPAPAFLAAMAQRGVELLWDLRPLDVVKAAIRAGDCAAHFAPDSLRQACRGRLRCYRHWPIGTSAAGGLAKHLFRSEEGATLVYRLLREAQSSVLCVLSSKAQWREDDLRQSVAVALSRAGALVEHLAIEARAPALASVSEEYHPAEFELPSRLRPAEKVAVEDTVKGRRRWARGGEDDSGAAVQGAADCSGGIAGAAEEGLQVQRSEVFKDGPKGRWNRASRSLPTESIESQIHNCGS
eukprot:TRINITY_DN59731_c0_g1_i1.p1 TRINITY_DN59731_c0_g1~~TRINITY_DN59731_c0_g1_i1.p1  ORF type:complete len:642 (-),score=88.46 TRINITY_DN59731_c0_g1_i1:230-2074(-)